MLVFISAGELVVVFFVVLLLFGAKSIPDIARSLGKTYNQVQHYTNDIKQEFQDDTEVLNDIGEKDIREKSKPQKGDDEFWKG